MSLIDQALKAAQREKSRLDAEAGRTVAPVLVRLRTQPRQGIDRNHILIGAGVIATVVAGVLWVRATREAPLPNVPPVTSAILTEALTSENVQQAAVPSGPALRLPADTAAAVAAAPPGATEPRVPDAAPSATIVSESEDHGATAPGEYDRRPEDHRAAEPRPRPAGTLRVSVEQPRNATAAELFSAAIAAHRAQDLSRAKSLYERVLGITPSDGDALNNLAVILSSERDLDRAHALLRRAVSVAPHNAGAWNNLGNLLREQGKGDEALSAFRQALAVDPRHQGARIGLAQQYLATNALPQARELLEDALRVNLALAEAHYTLGQVLELQGDRLGAVASYESFIRFAPDRLAMHVELVRRRIDLLSAAR